MPVLGKRHPWGGRYRGCMLVAVRPPLLCGSFNLSPLEYALWGFASCTLFFWLVADSCFRILYSVLARLLESAVSFLSPSYVFFHLLVHTDTNYPTTLFRAADQPG